MTLTEYEAAVLVLPAWQRGTAAGPAYALRQRLVVDPVFTTARDVIAGQRHHNQRLASIGQLANFQALTGP